MKPFSKAKECPTKKAAQAGKLVKTKAVKVKPGKHRIAGRNAK